MVFGKPTFIFNLNLTSLFVVVGVQAYDPQTMYDNPYFRSAVDETARVQNQQLPQEVVLLLVQLVSHSHLSCHI